MFNLQALLPSDPLARRMVAAFATGLFGYPLFKIFEPTARTFIIILSVRSVINTSVELFKVHSPVPMALLRSFGYSVAFIVGLGIPVLAYRLSPIHPLAKFPGPRWAKISKWWMAYWVSKGKRPVVIQKLHEKYGPWVRIGPTELSVNSSEAIWPVYHQMSRAPYYQGSPNETGTLISVKDKEEYNRRLTASMKAFSPEHLKHYQGISKTRATQLVGILRGYSKASSAVDLSQWFTFWSLDVIGDVTISGGFEMMTAGKDGDGVIEALRAKARSAAILGQVPWIRNVANFGGKPDYVVRLNKLLTSKLANNKRAGSSRNILSIVQEQSQLNDKQVLADASFLILAGSDPISQALTAFFRYVVADPAVYAQLREEIDAAYQESSGVDISDVALEKLSFLDACVQESLRLRPPVAAGPPRYSTAGGVEVFGRLVPRGTTMSTPIYTMHRERLNFEQPTQFKPQRWLSATAETEKTAERGGGAHDDSAFIPFGAGIGACIGKSIALYNIKLLAGVLIRTFDVTFKKGFDVRKFDGSYKEVNVWTHDPLLVNLSERRL